MVHEEKKTSAFLSKIHRIFDDWELLGILLIAALGFTFALFGFRDYFAREEHRSALDGLYATLQLLHFHFHWQEGHPINGLLQIGRFLLGFAVLYAAGKGIYYLLKNQARLRWIRLHGRRHIIICGLGQKGTFLTRGFRDQGYRVVVVDKNNDNSSLRLCRGYGAAEVIGDATEPATLHKAGIQTARYLIAACEDHRTNLEIANCAEKMAGKRKIPLTCIVHISEPRLCHSLRGWEFKPEPVRGFALEFFSIYRDGARSLLCEHPAFDGLPSAHVLIVGMGLMGQSLLERIAREWRRAQGPACKRIKISIVDPNALDVSRQLISRYPRLEKVCEVIPHTVRFPSPEFEYGAFLSDRDGSCSVSRVYVCLENNTDSLSAALTLLRRLEAEKVPVVTVVDRGEGLPRVIPANSGGVGQSPLFAEFGLVTKTCDARLLALGIHERVARALHESAVRHTLARHTGGDQAALKTSLVPWTELGEDFRESSRDSARYTAARLKAIGCSLHPLVDWDNGFFAFSRKELEILAQNEHARWLKERRSAGWRLGDDVPENKTSPWLKAWSEFTIEEQRDAMDRASDLPGVLAEVEIAIHRKTYEIPAQELFRDFMVNGWLLGPGPPEKSTVRFWEDADEKTRAWFRQKTDSIAARLAEFGYSVIPLPDGRCRLFPEIRKDEDEICALENTNWEQLDLAAKENQREAVRRLPTVFGCADFQIGMEPEVAVARAFHELYVEDQKSRGDTLERNPFLVSWHRLPGYKKESNLKEAEHVTEKARFIGCRIRAVLDANAPLFEYVGDEVERLAQMEHARWCEEMSRAGWTYAAAPKDAERRTNPNLVSWNELSEPLKETNRSLIRNIPVILRKIGRELHRMPEDELGRAIHEHYVSTQTARGDSPDTNSSLVAWFDLPEDLRDSNRRQAADIEAKAEAIGCYVSRTPCPKGETVVALEPHEIEMLAVWEHERWMKEREAAGWRYGPKPKNPVLKTHPCLVPWDQLDKEDQDKDRSTVREIPHFVKAAGLYLCRQKTKE